MQKKNKWIVSILVAVILIAVVSGGSFKFQIAGTDSKPTTIYEPNFASGRCQLASSDTTLTNGVIDSAVSGKRYSSYYTVVEMQCLANTDKCKSFTVQNSAGSIYRAKCPLNAVITNIDDLKARCTGYEGIGATLFSLPYYLGEYDFNVNTDYFKNNEKLVIVHAGLIAPKSGDFVTTIKADRYDLQGVQGNGLTTTASGTCNLKYLNQNIDISQKDIADMKARGDLSGFEDVLFGKSFNYIAGMKQTLDSVNLVQKDGNWVYIQSVGKVCPLDKTKAGLIYADCRTPISAPEIVCIPFQTAGNKQCSQDGTKWVAELTCNSYGAGLPSGQVKVNNQLCETICSGGVIKYVNCKTLITCPEGSLFNYAQNKCVSTGDVTTPITEGCKVDSDCTNSTDPFWITRTCEKTSSYAGLVQSDIGQCTKHDSSGYWLIAAAIVGGLIFISTVAVISGNKK